jgi:eukaryotic-like serine/threonine-protein kinase
MPLTAGTRLGVYEILAPLGAGGMGEVYRAHDTKLGRSVAVKVLSEALASDPDRIARFEREAKVLASLNHPHIAALYGSEESDGWHFLVMELVEGETLAERIGNRPMPVPETLSIARQIAVALEAAHERGIVHRDLKPANVKITPDDAVKVLDFGLAKALGVADAAADSGAAGLTHSPTLTFAGATQAGMILGTAPYMSPEQAKGRAADKRSDVWAFGCVLYEMLTGRRAFEGDDVSETLASVIKGDPDWTALPSNVPHAVGALIQGCLKKDRKERIGDISTALFLLGQPLVAAHVPPASHTPRSLWRRGLPVAAGVVIGAVAVAALAWRPRPVPTPLAVTRFAIPLPPGQHLFTPRHVLAISPDGRQIAYAADERVYLRSMSESEPRVIAGADGTSPVFSPDSQWILFMTTADSSLKKAPVAGGAPTRISQLNTTPSGIRWDSDGILFALAGSGIMRVSADGGKPAVVVPIAAGDALPNGPQQLPGGVLLFTIARRTADDAPWDKAQIVVQSLKTGERKTIIEAGADARYVPTGHIVYAVSGTLFAVPFDVARLAVTGAAVPVVEGVARATSVSSGSAQYAFSDSGSLIYLEGPTSASRRDVLRFDRQGSAEALTVSPGAYAYPRVSPDGKRLALETHEAKETNVAIYDLSGSSAVRRLTFGGNNRFPIWSADGQRLAFQSDREGDAAVFWQPADGGSAERLTKPEPGTIHLPESWSPTRDVLLFSAAKGSDVSLWTFDVRERKATAFSDVRSTNFATDAVFSPDGRWVAYQIGEPGQAEATTYVQPFPPNGTKYQIGRGGRPAWSRDGSELFYVPAPGQFRAVKVRTQPTFEFSNPISIPRNFGIADPINPRPYDVTPDGRFVGIGTALQAGTGSTRSTQIHVVLNWFEELKVRVPAR